VWRDWSQEGVLQEAKARGRENTTTGDYADSAPKRRVTTRERARCGHENGSSHEEEGDGILVERMFESSNKASLGMIECSSMSIEEEEGNGDGMVIESVERSEKSENVRGMEIVSQLDGRGLHPNGGEASSNVMAYGYRTGSQWNGPGVNDLVPHPVSSCPHNMDENERLVGERYGKAVTARKAIVQW
jgi:hypothetical protein